MFGFLFSLLLSLLSPLFFSLLQVCLDSLGEFFHFISICLRHREKRARAHTHTPLPFCLFIPQILGLSQAEARAPNPIQVFGVSGEDWRQLKHPGLPPRVQFSRQLVAEAGLEPRASGRDAGDLGSG